MVIPWNLLALRTTVCIGQETRFSVRLDLYCNVDVAAARSWQLLSCMELYSWPVVDAVSCLAMLTVDEKERQNGNNPERELNDSDFHTYCRPSVYTCTFIILTYRWPSFITTLVLCNNVHKLTLQCSWNLTRLCKQLCCGKFFLSYILNCPECNQLRC